MIWDTHDKELLIRNSQLHDKDRGSAQVQLHLLKVKIKYLADHFKLHPKDYHSKRGLFKMIGRMKRLGKYINRVEKEKK